MEDKKVMEQELLDKIVDQDHRNTMVFACTLGEDDNYRLVVEPNSFDEVLATIYEITYNEQGEAICKSLDECETFRVLCQCIDEIYRSDVPDKERYSEFLQMLGRYAKKANEWYDSMYWGYIVNDINTNGNAEEDKREYLSNMSKLYTRRPNNMFDMASKLIYKVYTHSKEAQEAFDVNAIVNLFKSVLNY